MKVAGKINSSITVILGIIFFTISVILFGCVQNTLVNNTNQNATITLSGKLVSGTITGFGVKTFSNAVSSYTVVAINNDSGKTYYGATDGSGNFSIKNVPTGDYETSLVDSNSSYFGPVVMKGGDSEVVMGITPDKDTNLGEIVVDEAKYIAKPAVEPTDSVNLNDTALASNGIPKGAVDHNLGKGADTLTSSTRDGSDMDKDGIPNIFDADENGDGIRNGIKESASTDEVNSVVVETVFMGMNIWSRHGDAFDAKDAIALRLQVIPRSGKESEIKSVSVIDVPASIKDVATVAWASSLGNLDSSYPAERSLWKDANYGMYRTEINGKISWIVSIVPRALPNVGDVFKIRVTYTDDSYEDFFKSISYVLTDVPKIIKYNNISVPGISGTSYSNPILFSGSSLALEFSKPKDESGNEISGLQYSIGIWHLNSNGDKLSENETSSGLIDNGTTMTYTYSNLPDDVGGAAIDNYYIVPIANTAGGQRNGEEIWFKKQ